jgi:inosose dehydratase
MASLGFTATELGPPGFLPEQPDELRAMLDEHGLRLAGGFVPLVLHDRSVAGSTMALAERTADLFAAVGADMFVTAVVVDLTWAPRRPLDDDEWTHIVTMLGRLDELTASRGVGHVVHPHVGTLIEDADDVARLLATSDVRWCLDTGHLTIGGVDPVAFARDYGARVGHVHLKDVDAAVAARVQSGELGLMAAVQQGLFRPLGRGDVAIDEVVAHLEGSGYDGWYVLEQDMAMTGAPPPPGSGPVLSVKESIEHLRATSAGQPALG